MGTHTHMHSYNMVLICCTVESIQFYPAPSSEIKEFGGHSLEKQAQVVNKAHAALVTQTPILWGTLYT